MKSRHLVLTAAAVMLLSACTQSGFRNLDTVVEGIADNGVVVHVSAVERNAAGGDPESQRLLGNRYYWGEHVDQNESKAVAWWSRAADKGDAEAQLNLSKVMAGEPVNGEMHASVGRELWASAEESYFAATDEFETTLLPFQDASLGEDLGKAEDPSVLEGILAPIGSALTAIGSAITGQSSD